MSKINRLALFVILAGGLIFPGSALSRAPQAPALKTPHSAGVHSDKHCEKCKRGPDGKMECEPAPCP